MLFYIPKNVSIALKVMTSSHQSTNFLITPRICLLQNKPQIFNRHIKPEYLQPKIMSPSPFFDLEFYRSSAMFKYAPKNIHLVKYWKKG